MRISALVAALAFGVSAQSAPRFNITEPSLAHHCRDKADKYLLTQRQAGGVTYAFCHDLAKTYHDTPNNVTQDQYYFNCFCMNQPWAESYTGCLAYNSKWHHKKLKKEANQAAVDRCWACHKKYPPEDPYQYPRFYNCTNYRHKVWDAEELSRGGF